ncbi:ribonuclease HII [Candidatus Saccharibacteria bacterium]|nr:ribonuclease HII [Candidatus Saccharibacteria bacterium]
MITVGIDEVGRGCWAGPLVAAAVVLQRPIIGLKDSKKLTKLQREKLVKTIESDAMSVGIGWVWPEQIDDIGLSKAVELAMHRAMAEISCNYDEVIIDGNINYFNGNPKARAVVRADDTVPAVSAASIVAKVARDNYMTEAARKHPGYGFERHVGYGTAEHIRQLKQLGVSEIHRLSYKPIRALLGLGS